MNKDSFDRNIPFNSLPLLPPDKEIEGDIRILNKLVTATRSLANFNGNLLRLPNPLMLVNTIALREAKTSTEIENIFTTEDELYKAISDSQKEKGTDVATKEVLRYREALWAGYNAMESNGHIKLEQIIKIYQQIKNTNASLRSPQSHIVIKRGSSEFRFGEVIYTPPRGKEILETLLDNLIEYLNDDDKYPTDPILKMCISHYQFESIHPFADGNGRTGRILNLLTLVNKGLLTHPVLYLSKYIILNKDDYYFKLSGVTQRNDWRSWILYMLDAVEKTSEYSSDLVASILSQMESTYIYGKERIKWYNKEVNEKLFSQPYIKPKTIGEILDKSSRTTLTKYFRELVQHQILRPIKEGSEIYYVNDDLIRILEN